jgi:DNA-binding MarR family transcriptional regulator
VIDDLSFDLHALVAKLDRSADRILRTEIGVSYRRFLLLFMVRDLGGTTQRALADRLNVSEPSVSRMTSVLREAGMLDADPDPAGGNRRQLALTPRGDELVDRCRALLSDRFKVLVELSGISVGAYARDTKRLLAVLAEGGAQDNGDAQDVNTAAAL